MKRLLAVLPIVLPLVGCNILADLGLPFFTPPAPDETDSSKLIPFASEQELVDYFTGQIRSQNEIASGDDAGFAPTDGVETNRDEAAGGDIGQLDSTPTAAPGADTSLSADAPAFSGTTDRKSVV